MIRITQRLRKLIREYENGGYTFKRLGIVNMPIGYALFLNLDLTHYFYLRFDGEESEPHCNKWAVYSLAKEDQRKISENYWTKFQYKEDG